MRSDASGRRRFLARTVVVTSTLGLGGCLTGGSDNSGDRGPGTTTTEEETSTEVVREETTTDNTEPPGETTTEIPSSSESGDSTPEGPRTVSFDAPHGVTIEATAYGSGDCGIVLVPQINLDRGSWQPQAEMIAEMGHLALAIDEDPDNRSASVRGAIRYLRQQQNVSTVILVGASTGGEAVAIANTKADTAVDGTITLSAAGGADHASKLQGRSLFIVSKGDEDRFVRIAQELHQGASEPKNLVEYEGSAHGQRIFTSGHSDDLQDRVRTFISEVCEK